jgi:hypothetical protein
LLQPTQARQKMEKIFGLVASPNDGEASSAALKLREMSEKYGISIFHLNSLCSYPKEDLQSRTLSLWKEAGFSVLEKKPAQKSFSDFVEFIRFGIRFKNLKKVHVSKVSRPRKDNPQHKHQEPRVEPKFDFYTKPGEDWIWIAQHKRVSSKGKTFTVRGHWRLKPGRKGESKKAA